MKEFRKNRGFFLIFKGFSLISKDSVISVIYHIPYEIKGNPLKTKKIFRFFSKSAIFFEISSFHAISPIFSTMVAIDLTLSFGPVLISPN